MIEFLSREAVRRLTGGKVKYHAQRAALDRLGIRYTRNEAGEPLVRETDLDAPSQRGARNVGPRWDLIGNARARPRRRP